MNRLPIVVGYDGLPGAQTALHWALEEAARRSVPVRLVYVVEPPMTSGSMFPMPFDYSPEAYRMRLQSLLADVTAEAARRQPAVEVTPDLVDGPTVSALCALSDDAEMIVLGSRGLGGFTGLLVGSTGVAVAAHARCPVVVVRDGDPADRQGQPVVVGVDESPQAQLAAQFAFDEAAARGVDLVAVRAWTPPAPPWRSDVRPLVKDVAELETAERHLLRAAIEAWADKYPTVRVDTRLIANDARHALAQASAQAQLVVVGNRGGGGFAGLVLGSVSHFLLHHAHCPVAVVRSRT